MLTNGRSSAPGAFIQTSDEKRRQIWLHVFGSDILPIIGTGPRFQAMQGRGHDVLAYDLRLSELSQAQRARFAGYLSQKHRMDYQAVLAELETAVSWPIKASFDVRVVEPAEEQAPLASLLPGGWHEKARRFNRWLKRPLVAMS